MPTVTSENKAEFDRKALGSKDVKKNSELSFEDLNNKLAKELSPHAHLAYYVLKSAPRKDVHPYVRHRALQNLPKEAIAEAKDYIAKED